MQNEILEPSFTNDQNGFDFLYLLRFSWSDKELHFNGQILEFDIDRELTDGL